MKPVLSRFVSDEAGTTAIEYGLVACILSITLVAALILVGPELQALYGRIHDVVGSAGN
jgi:pilus assembly protein Flp/PilA